MLIHFYIYFVHFVYTASKTYIHQWPELPSSGGPYEQDTQYTLTFSISFTNWVHTCGTCSSNAYITIGNMGISDATVTIKNGRTGMVRLVAIGY